MLMQKDIGEKFSWCGTEKVSQHFHTLPEVEGQEEQGRPVGLWWISVGGKRDPMAEAAEQTT